MVTMNRLQNIKAFDKSSAEKAAEKWNSIAKPLHSLGIFEDYIIKLAGIFADENFDINKRCVVVMCADNGVVCEGVTQTDSSVTAIAANAIANGTSNINMIAKSVHADVIAVDVGMNTEINNKNIIVNKASRGTNNIANGRAMSIAQAEKTIGSGIDIVCDLKSKGYKIIVTGEMGIGNTTTSAAVTSALLELPPEMVTGKGAGLDDERLVKKIKTVERAIKTNKPDKNDPLDILSKLGGYDIAGMTGLFLGGAVCGIPIVIDGVISVAAAALAVKICPEAKNYMLCSHASNEPASKTLLEYLGQKPVITANMSLGEGTGGAMLLSLLDSALSVYNSAHRFDSLPMERYVEL